MEMGVECVGASATLNLDKAYAKSGDRLLGALRKLGLRMQGMMIRKLTNDALKVRTGNLRRAVSYRIEERIGETILRVGVDLGKAAYGRVQNLGGTIVPKKAKFLTIPLAPNLTGNGVMRVNAREFIANPQSIGFTGSFVNRRKTAIMGVRPGGEVEPVFALAKSVRIKPTGFIASTLENSMGDIEKEFKVAADQIAADGNGASN